MNFNGSLRIALLFFLCSLAFASCITGGSDEEPVPAANTQSAQQLAASSPVPQTTQPPGSEQTTPAEVIPPTATEPQSAELTEAQLAEIQPNELGWIPVLQYHNFEDIVTDNFTRTPEQFTADLQWLYDHNFFIVNMDDYLNDTMEIPAGKHPVILTFDDGPASQFMLVEQSDGQLTVDSRCAIGILENFLREHPDFGRGGHFAILPDRTFAWHPTEDRSDQTPYAEMKLKWLIDNGYEIGNHTLDHANLSLISNEEVQYQLAEASLMIEDQLPGAEITVVTLPYGGYPNGGDDTVFKGFEYQGRHFEYQAVLLVGANPAFSIYSTEYDPYAVPRIQAFDEELDKWFSFMEEEPGILYTSDGNPETLTIPLELHWGLVDTFDEQRASGQTIIRY